MCIKPRHKKLNYRVTHKILQEEWWVSQSNLEKKKVSAQKGKVPELASTEIAPFSGVKMIGWTRTHLKQKVNFSCHKIDESKRDFEKSEDKLTGVNEAEKTEDQGWSPGR